MQHRAEGSRRVKFAALIVAWAVVAVAAVAVGLDRFERDLGDRATIALAAAGVPVVSLAVDGRDLVVTGPESSQSAVEATLSAVEGVARVRWTSSGAADAGTEASGREALDETGGDPSGSTTTVPPTTTTIAPDPDQPHFVAVLDAGVLTVTGAVADAEAAARFAALSELIYAPYLDNGLVVDPDLEPAAWVPGVGPVIAVLPIVSTASLEVAGGRASLRAEAPSEERAEQLIGAVAAALGEGVMLDTDVTVTGERPPSIDVTAPGDGSVRLEGTLPSEDLLERIRSTAFEVFGPDNVIDDLEVGEGIHDTFSLYRLPLTFPAFRPFQQWNVSILDDRISGNLRGGATFRSGSAQLTPELEQLLQIAAGILSRNPSLLLTVEGHTDAVGSDEDNLDLSQRRADAAVRWLIAAGIQSPRLFAVGYGEARPIGDNSTPEGRALNRRIEFRLGPPDSQGGTG